MLEEKVIVQQGLRGEKGERGEKGDPGEKGDRGPRGPAGPEGVSPDEVKEILLGLLQDPEVVQILKELLKPARDSSSTQLRL